jgi:hypothetical protein
MSEVTLEPRLARAVAIAWHGVRINQWYGASLGKTEETSTLLAGLSVCADGLALIPQPRLPQLKSIGGDIQKTTAMKARFHHIGGTSVSIDWIFQNSPRFLRVILAVPYNLWLETALPYSLQPNETQGHYMTVIGYARVSTTDQDLC